jgi:hypothetical protein
MYLAGLCQAHKLTCSYPACGYRLVQGQYLDLAAAIATLSKSTVASIGPYYKDLVAFGRYQNLLCVHGCLVYNRP